MATDKIELLIEAKVKGAIAGLKQVEKQSKKTEGVFKSLNKTWIKVAAVAVIAAIGMKKAFDFSKEFLEFKQATQAMEKQFGVSSNKIIKKLKEVSGGTISMKNIVLSANRAMALGVTKDVGTMAKLLEIARLRGRALGLDTKKAFDDLVVGVGRGSPMILDNLGIMIKGLADQARAQGKTVDSQLILNAVLADGAALIARTGTAALTGAEKIQRFNARLADSRVLLGKLINQELVVFADTLEDIGDSVTPLKIVEKTFKSFAFSASVAVQSTRALFNALQLIAAPLTALQSIALTVDFTKGIKGFTTSIKNLKGNGIKAFKELKESTKEDIGDIGDSFDKMKNRFLAIFKEMKEENDTFTGSVVENAKKVTVKTAAELKKEAAIRKQITQTSLTIAGNMFDAFFEVQANQRQAALDNELKLTQEALEKELDFLESTKRDALKGLDEKFAAEDKQIELEAFNDKLARLQAEKDEAIRVGDEQLAAKKQMDIDEAKSDKKKNEAKTANEKKRSDEQAAIEEQFRVDKEAKEAATAAEEKRIKTEQFEAEKKAAKIGIIVNTAVGVMKGFAQLGPIGGAIAAIGTVAAGIAQGVVVDRQPLPAFKDGGVAPGGPILVGEVGAEVITPPRGSVITPNNQISNTESNDFSKREFHFHGIQDLSQVRNELLRTEGVDAF